MISTDKNIFNKESAVAKRQVEYAKGYEEVHIIIFTKKDSAKRKDTVKEEKEKFIETSIGSNIWVYPTYSISKWFYVFDALKLGRFIVVKKGITNITCQDPFETGLVGALIRNRHKIRLELQIHTDIGSPYFRDFSFLNRTRFFISKYTLTRADTVRVVSERIKDYVKKYIDESKIEVRPISIDIEKIKNTVITVDLHKKYSQFSSIVLIVSRLEKEKNIDMALRAFEIVLGKIPKAGLVIVGSGNEETRLKNLSRNMGVESSIIFESYQNNLDILYSYYKSCDCFLLTSWYEGYGMALVEAHTAGCRIVSTDVGVARELGTFIVDYDTNEIAGKIVELIENNY